VSENSTVYLVGAGPGDPDLMTVKARRLIETADVVVYDRLVAPEILALVPAGTARIYVGKQPNDHPVPQDEINRLLAAMAQVGRVVVRLKGGDPFLFGRGSEEMAYLRDRGIHVEIVPGVTSASACASSIGVPLTHRGLATGVRFLTGHCREDMDLDFDWRGLADPDTTLVIYMGMANIPQIVAKLLENGLDVGLPVAAIASGTTARQRHIVSTLAGIVGDVRAAALEGPVLFVIGRVVALADSALATNPVAAVEVRVG